MFTKEQLANFNATRTSAHEILFYDPDKTLIFAKCKTTTEPKVFPFSVPAELDRVPLVFSRTFQGEIEVYDANTSELIGKNSDPEYQDDGFGSSKIPSGDYNFILLPDTLQYCVSTNNKEHRITPTAEYRLEPDEEMFLAEFSEYLCVYGKILVDGVEHEDTMLEPNTYSSIKALDEPGYVTQITVTDLYSGLRIDLVDAQANKRAEMKEICKAMLSGGFSSDALGEVHTYPSDQEAQFDLFASASLGLDVLFKCTINGVTTKKLHTALQLNQVLNHGVVFKVSTIAQKDDRVSQINASTSMGHLASIQW